MLFCRSDMHHAHMNLARIRALKGFPTQADLAEVLGVDQATVHRMEVGSSAVSLRRYKAAADILGVTLAELFADSRSEAETLLVHHWRSLSETDQSRWLEHLRLAAGHQPQAASRSLETGQP